MLCISFAAKEGSEVYEYIQFVSIKNIKSFLSHVTQVFFWKLYLVNRPFFFRIRSVCYVYLLLQGKALHSMNHIL